MAKIMHKTKDTNTFRFKSFADRVGEIDIRRLALYHIGHENEELPEDNETYFYQTLKKWMVLNLTDEFGSFSRRCLKIVTLPQLIHKKEFVVDLLLERLATVTNLALQPLLELLYVLARDLREEFYPYFHRVLDRLICLLNTKDAEQLEWTLVCLAYLFKTLKPHLKKNIGVVFHAILPLLDEHRYEEHVTNFAVECFSFIARDVRDYSKFLDFILETVEREQVESVQSCGRLFFEIVRGVKGQFHSIAGEFLQFIFECLIDEKCKSQLKLQLLCDIVSHAVDELLRFIHPQNINLLWLKLCDVAAHAIQHASKISNLTAVFLQAAQYKDGLFLAELDVVVPTVLKMCDACMQPQADEALQLLAQLVCKILLSGSTQLTQLDTSRLLKKVLTLKQRKIFSEFIVSITTHAQFEILVLPAVIHYFELHFDLESLELMAKIVLQKQPLALHATGLQSWHIYPIQLKKPETLKKISSKIENLSIEDGEQLSEETLLFLVLLPHLSALPKEPLEAPLKVVTSQLLTKVPTSTNLDKELIMLSLLLETQIHLDFKFDSNYTNKAIKALLPQTANSRALCALDQLLTHYAATPKECITLSAALAPLLSSHEHEVRLTVSHCLLVLHSRNKHHNNPYHIFYQAECLEPNIHNYREQLLLLQKLHTAGEYFKSLKDDNYKLDTLRFLLGMLYHNFKYVWEPVQKLIEEYAKELDTQEFWDIYKLKLQATARAIDYAVGQADASLYTNEYWCSSALRQLLPATAETILTQQQLCNYRVLLWSRLPQFGSVVEVKNRELVTLFLQFVKEEYSKHLETREFTWNLREQSRDEQLELDVEDQEPEDDVTRGATTRGKYKRKRKEQQSSGIVRQILQTLQCKLGIFVAQSNPKALYREPELYSFYMDLLAGPNAQLQKLALDCVYTYKSKELLPYKDHLYAISDEQKFRDELISFKLDTINAEHREQLMHILLRLLYGKMLTKGTQRQMSAQVRKGLILRFLGQCSTDEIFWFLRMAFGKYEQYASAGLQLESVPTLVQADFSLEAVYSAKKMQSIVNLLELIRKEFGGLMENNFHLYMLQLLTFVGATSNEVLRADASQLHPKMPGIYKQVRNAALLSLVNFFTHIEQFPWQVAQIECLSAVFVWPNIERLPQESIHTPTPLLKLLLQWGEKPHHFTYLQQKREECLPIFHYVVGLLLQEKAKTAVRKPILALIERLLVTAGADASSPLSAYSSDALGLIKPYIPQILKRLKTNFSTRSAKKALDKHDLNILSLLTAHVEEPETCDSLLQLLLPILIAKSQSNDSEEVVCQVITTLSNLIKRLDTPETYLLKVAPLFEQVQEVAARKLLCQLVADIAKKRHKQAKIGGEVDDPICTRIKDIARIVLMLNAWDKRWVDQPDYDKRLDALKDTKHKLEAGTVDMDLGVLVIYNCFYFLRHDKDIGLRDNASEHLQMLLPKLTQQYATEKQQVDYLVGDVFINLVRRVIIRDTNDNARNEGIRLLGVMARQCSEAHEVLQDLHPLSDSQDSEVDFFENLVHLQTHRHGRALLKFCSHAESLTQAPSVRTLTQFMLPLATRYLLEEKYAGKHTLIDAAIETVGIVCQLLPWQHYHAVLRYYLMKLRIKHDYQKQCVRIVVRILDAFHFNLSQTHVDPETLDQLKIELTAKLELPETAGKAPLVSKIIKTKGDDLEKPEEEEEATDTVHQESNLDTELANVAVAEDEEGHQQLVVVTAEHEPIMKKPLLLPPNASKRVLSAITTVLIPTLNHAITEKSSYDNKHKVNRKRFSAEREEEEILRVPIALALVKLMQKLPKELLDTSLPGVFMKVCTFLRSPLKSVRMLARDILRKIMLTLGPSYLAMLMDHLQSLLTRGFQVHVLAVTVHGVLDALRDCLQPGDLEGCLGNLLDVALNDIFGELNAEKELDKFVAHTPEAKPSAKSYLVLHIAARNIKESCLLDLLLPFKELLARSHFRKVTLKIQDCFAKIVAGLVENPHIARESLLIFIYGTMSESISDLLPGTQKRMFTEQEKEQMRRSRPDCLLIQPPPRRRSGVMYNQVKSNVQVNAHILVEFGLEMLHIMLKRKKLIGGDYNYQPFLNPMLPLLRDALKSTHLRVTSFALNCLASIWNEEYVLPALQQYLDEMVRRMFEILQNFSTFGVVKQDDNLQLMKATFKAVVALLRKCSEYQFSAEQIDQLVLHVEQDLYEGENQTTSFALLKAMIARKVDTPSIHDVLKSIGDLSIVSYSDFVRDEARGILLTYLMEYTLKKRVDQIIKFFTVQLSYALPTGRQSAIKMLHLIIKKFHSNMLSRRAELLYLSLGTRLVNDEDSDCRKAVAECLELLITRLEKADRQRLFDMTLLFFDAAHQPTVREMAAALCSRFLNAEKQAFAPRLPLVLPNIVARLTLSNPKVPGRFVRAPGTLDIDAEDVQRRHKKKPQKGKKRSFDMDDLSGAAILPDDAATKEIIVSKQRDVDHEIIQMQYCLLKMLEYCAEDLLANEALINTLDELAYESQNLLAHEHSWVRCNAAKILAHIISTYDFVYVGQKLCKKKVELKQEQQPKLDFINLNPEYDIKSLVLDLCAQMVPGDTPQAMIDEIVKILLLVGNMLRDVPLGLKQHQEAEDEQEQKRSLQNGADCGLPTKLNLHWLVRNIRFLLNKEVAKAPHCISMRSALFTLIEGLITLLSVEMLEKLAPALLLSLVREMSEDDLNVDLILRQQALRVGSRLRKRIGSDLYDKMRAGAQTKLMMRRAKRKKLITQEKINDPVRAAKRKVGMQERKKASKKRKTDILRGKVEDVKQKLKKRKRKSAEDLF